MHLLVFAYCFFSQCVITVLIAATLSAYSICQRNFVSHLQKAHRARTPMLGCWLGALCAEARLLKLLQQQETHDKLSCDIGCQCSRADGCMRLATRRRFSTAIGSAAAL